jgi:inner membrane protein
MNRIGHLGFSLFLFSPFLVLFPAKDVVSAVVFSLLPDIDLILKIKHRIYTHNFAFAFALFFTFFILLGDIKMSFFIFLGIISHILADLLTKTPFAPFYPISGKKFALKLFRSDNKIVNYSLILLGTISFAYFYGIKI